MTTEIPLNKRDFERALTQLRRDTMSADDNPGSYKSEGCERCYGCMFTIGSKDCFSCTYCRDCEQCTDCTHCKACRNCYDSKYCVDSVNCPRGSYLVQSESCVDCVFCFGCVGLVKKEFHILNQPFPRDMYFKLLEELKPLFGYA